MILFLDNLSFHFRELSPGSRQKREAKRGQNQDDFGKDVQLRRNTMKGMYVYEAEKR